MNEPDDRRSPVRVCHVVGGMVQGGIETWLMHVLRSTPPDEVVMDFLVHDVTPGAYDEEVRARGSRIIQGPSPRDLLHYPAKLEAVLREHGPYDVVHAHVHHFSGVVLRSAHRAGVPKRVAHSHNDTSPRDRAAGLPRRGYHHAMRWQIRRHSTVALAASEVAATALYGRGWQEDEHHQVLHYGIDLEPFRRPQARADVLEELGMAAHHKVVVHVGRFQPQKNHEFVVAIGAALAEQTDDVVLLLIGDGPSRPGLERAVAERGLSERVIFAGAREDVPRVLCSTADAFVLPSFHEGLPLVLIEAQAAALPCVVTSNISDEVDVVQGLVQRLSLDEPAEAWARAVVARLAEPRERARALSALTDSSLDIKRSGARLRAVYRG